MQLADIKFSRMSLGKRLLMNIKQHPWFYVMIIPALAYFIVFHYAPMYGVIIAFQDYKPFKGISGSAWVGIKHFHDFITGPFFWRLIRNTLSINLGMLVFGFPLPILFALLLNEVRSVGFKRVVQTITYMPHFISTVVLVGMLHQVFNPVTGLYGNIYRLFVPGEYPVDILAKSYSFRHMYVWSGIWQNLGWNTIIYMAALSGVDPELHEAAQIDGATRLKRVWYIDLPVLLPTASILLIMNSGSIMSVGFEKVYLMQNSLNLVQSEVISTYVYKTGLGGQANQLSYSAAIGLFNNIINGILLVVVNTLSKKLSDGNNSLF